MIEETNDPAEMELAQEIQGGLGRLESLDSPNASRLTTVVHEETEKSLEVPEERQENGTTLQETTCSTSDKFLERIQEKGCDQVEGDVESQPRSPLGCSLSSSTSTQSRKRPADSDFLSVEADVKRIGVEMSEEETSQLRNDVKRLSPVVISLRERTLGEISLTPDSKHFGENVKPSTSRSQAEIISDSVEHSPTVSSVPQVSCTESSKINEDSSNVRSDLSLEEECSSSFEITDAKKKLPFDENDEDNADKSDDRGNDEDSCSSTSFHKEEVPPSCDHVDDETSKLITEILVSPRRMTVRLDRINVTNYIRTDSKKLVGPRRAIRKKEKTVAKNTSETLSPRRCLVVLKRIDEERKSNENIKMNGYVEETDVGPGDSREESSWEKEEASPAGKIDACGTTQEDSIGLAASSFEAKERDNDEDVSCKEESSMTVEGDKEKEKQEQEESYDDSMSERPLEDILKDLEKENRETNDLRTKSSEEQDRTPRKDVTKSCSVVISAIVIKEDANEKEKSQLAKDASPRRSTVVQKSWKEEVPSGAIIIEKLEEEEEVVLTSSSACSSKDGASLTLDSSKMTSTVTTTTTMPDSPEEALEASTDVQEAIDTETETETGSDSSELPSMPIVRVRDSCETEDTADRASCAENETENDSETLCCDEIATEMMTRLEPEKPEPFTEDSAESLALTTGARDEVRSDGSDSGLGSEIPGDPGPAPAPESDSETSFLDRIPDDILSDKEKAVNQLESFVPDESVPGTPQTTLTTFRSPAKSNLKRRLTDCMEGEPSPKRSNTEEPMKKKRNIHFDAVTVYYFPRAQGFTCVPSQGGSTLGMSATHTHAERFSLSEHAAEQRRLHRARLAQLRSERAANCGTEPASSSEDPSDDTDEEPSDNDELDIDSYYFLQPVPTWQRRALLRAAGVRRIDAVEKDECRDIRASREHCGCGCKGYCDPESCPCSRANVKCQVDRAGFPCGCTRDGCANSSGRIEFNPVRVRTHFIHTLMRLQLEKKQRDEEGIDHEDGTDNRNNKSGPLRDINLGSLMDNSNTEACISGGGFTTLHYENHDGGNGNSNCQPEVPGTREDSLDLYAIRDDCYPSEETVDGTPGGQRKLHPEFSQAFQTFSGQAGANMNFQQTAYQDYQAYTNLPSTSRVQFQPQFQPVPGSPGFSHYAVYGQDGTSVQDSCQVHPGQHSSNYEAAFAQDEATGSQYTNLNSVQPMNGAAVQQIGKLEPFSELLSGRYSYYGEIEPQAHGSYHGNASKEGEKNETNEEQRSESTEECDENFGEIIKKSMVETVSA